MAVRDSNLAREITEKTCGPRLVVQSGTRVECIRPEQPDAKPMWYGTVSHQHLKSGKIRVVTDSGRIVDCTVRGGIMGRAGQGLFGLRVRVMS